MLKKFFICLALTLFFGNNISAAEETLKCKGTDDLCSKEFKLDIGIGGLGLGGEDLKGDTAKDTVDKVLGVIITKLMVAFGVLALFIMTVGGGYMIFSYGHDELLNKGKGIFTAGLISLIVALSSGIIIKIVIFLLYNTN